jgi:anti-sigma28 factor (negative regulator of flagellin synthesis)
MDAMRINRGDMTTNPEIELQPARSSREVVDSATPTASDGSGASDSIALTGVSSLAQLALTAGAGERADRVQQLKQMVDNNQYTIDPVSVSSALIGAHLSGE